MSRKTNNIWLKKPAKRFISLPDSMLRSVTFPVRWMSNWDRNGGLGTFIHKWYFGKF